MNFLLHHHLAARDLGSPLAAVGAMLPDLWRMADRRVHAVQVRADAGAPTALEHPRVADVLSGIRHHLDADVWFHACEPFRSGERRTGVALRAAAPEAPRIGLFAHILWEVCLDGAFVRRRGLAAVLSDLREGFAALQEGVPTAGARAAEIHHFDRVARSADERAAFERRMGALVEAVAEGPWIEGYQHGAGMVARLDGIRARFGFAALRGEERVRVADAVDALLVEADAAVEAVLAVSAAELRGAAEPATP